jgi:NTP pyrophosphatase (non-canonical NTP hydrolase)
MKKSGRKTPQKKKSKETIVYSFTDTDIVFTSYPEGIELEDNPQSLMSYISKITQWHYDRNLIEGSTDKDQTLKLVQELGELSDSVCKGKSVADDIGDMIVVLINIAERNKLRLVDCLEVAWNDIKDRKGKMVDGIFVKEES